MLATWLKLGVITFPVYTYELLGENEVDESCREHCMSEADVSYLIIGFFGPPLPGYFRGRFVFPISLLQMQR